MSGGAGFAGVQIASALLGGIEARAGARREARALDENARLSLLAGEQQAALTARDERQAAGAQIAMMAESGIAPGTGTALDLIRQSAMEREIEIGNIRAQAQGEARNYRQAAADARADGAAAAIGGVLAAGATGLDYSSRRSAQARVDAADARVRAAQTARRPVGGAYAAAPLPLTPRRRLRVFGPPAD